MAKQRDEITADRLADRLTKGEGRAYKFDEPATTVVLAGTTNTITFTAANNQREILKAFTAVLTGAGAMSDIRIRIRDSNEYRYTDTPSANSNLDSFIDGDLIGDNNHPWRFVEGLMALPAWKQLGAPIIVHPNQNLFVDVQNTSVGTRTVLLKFTGKRESGLLPTMRMQDKQYMEGVRSPNDGFYIPYFAAMRNTAIAAGDEVTFTVTPRENEEIIINKMAVLTDAAKELTIRLQDANSNELQPAALNYRVFGDNNHPTRFIEHPLRDDPRAEAGAPIAIPSGTSLRVIVRNPAGGAVGNIRILLQGKKEVSRKRNNFSLARRYNFRGGYYTPYIYMFDRTNAASAGGTDTLNTGSGEEVIFHKMAAPLVGARATLRFNDNLGQFYSSAAMEMNTIGDNNHPERNLDSIMRPNPEEENGAVLSITSTTAITTTITDTSGAGGRAILALHGKIERPTLPVRT